jgi:hypothetical protein
VRPALWHSTRIVPSNAIKGAPEGRYEINQQPQRTLCRATGGRGVCDDSGGAAGSMVADAGAGARSSVGNKKSGNGGISSSRVGVDMVGTP